MRKLLPDESNIKQFAARFSTIGACADSAQAKAFLFSDGARNAHSANATARRGCGQKVGLQREATECTQKSRKKWRSENMSDWDR